jgi:hypothetical protein
MAEIQIRHKDLPVKSIRYGAFSFGDAIPEISPVKYDGMVSASAGTRHPAGWQAIACSVVDIVQLSAKVAHTH